MTLRSPRGVLLDWRRRGKPPRKIAIIGDVHVPHHDEEAVAVAVAVCRAWIGDEAGEVWQTGDLCEAGKFTRHPRRSKQDEAPHPWLHELELAGAFWDELRDACPNSRMHWRLGNHEGRIERELVQCPWGDEVADALSPARVQDGRPWLTIHAWNRPTDAGPLLVLPDLALPHGAAEGRHATAAHLDLFAPLSVAHGHTHRVAHVVRRLADGRHQHALSPGCLARRQPAFFGERPSGHAHGIALIDVLDDGWSPCVLTIEGPPGRRRCLVPGLGEVRA